MDNNHKNSDQLNMEIKYLSFNYRNKIIILIKIKILIENVNENQLQLIDETVISLYYRYCYIENFKSNVFNILLFVL